MNKKSRGYNAYFILILLLLALLIIPSLLDNGHVEYTRGEMIQDLEDGNIVYAGISPSRQTPTGEVDFVLKNGAERTLYVTDVSEIEEILLSHGLDPEVKKVQEESWFLTSVFPVLIAIVVMVFFFVIMNSQNSGGNNKMMNFGKSRARLSMGDGKITLKDVAGLKEEKEELEEIVEFLRDPAKFTKVGARIPK
ncbi:MAG: cell division protein FtsH, partial [Lachnospiraceae bacterium]|nr:cell division protein FtsH [Lachnospiraceae bacterium]